MQNSQDCLNAMMFIAAESYSGSVYGEDLFRAMDEICDDMFMPLAELEADAVNMPALAA